MTQHNKIRVWGVLGGQKSKLQKSGKETKSAFYIRMVSDSIIRSNLKRAFTFQFIESQWRYSLDTRWMKAKRISLKLTWIRRMLTPSKKTKEYHKGPCGLENMYRKHWSYTSLSFVTNINHQKQLL